MFFGAFIENGPHNWQIIQQKGGYADIMLSGSSIPLKQSSNNKVFARIVREDSCEPVVQWFECDMQEDGQWHAIIRNIPAGGLYRIETCLNQENEPIEWSKRGGKNDVIPGQNSFDPYCSYRNPVGGDRPFWSDYKSARGEPDGDNYYSFFVGKLDKGNSEVFFDPDWNDIMDAIRRELVNQIENLEYADVLERLKDRLLQFLIETGDVVPFDADRRG